jgi:hypothetical protein
MTGKDPAYLILLATAVATSLLAACTYPTEPVPAGLIPSWHSASPTVLPSSSPPPTSSSPSIGAPIREECLSQQDAITLPQDTVLVLSGSGFQDDLYLLDLRTLSTTRLGYAELPVAVSPDRSQLAFIEAGKGLILADGNGNRRDKVPAPSDWNGVIAWLEDDSVLVEKMPYFGGHIDPPASVIALDLNDGSSHPLPDAAGLRAAWGGASDLPWGEYSMVGAVFDPTLASVAHIGQAPPDESGGLILSRVADNSEIAQLVGGIYSFGGGPRWSPSGDHFFVSAPVRRVTITGYDLAVPVNSDPTVPSLGGNEIFAVARDGSIARLTYLTSFLTAGEDAISLSPDSATLAFWLIKDYRLAEHPPQVLALLDIRSGDVTNLCMSPGEWPASEIYWSPDGGHLAFTVLDEHTRLPKVVVVDLAASEAMTIDKGLAVVGWMRQ